MFNFMHACGGINGVVGAVPRIRMGVCSGLAGRRLARRRRRRSSVVEK